MSDTNPLKVGRKYSDFRDGRRRLKLQVRISPNGKSKEPKLKKAAKTGVAAARQTRPLSTNVSSPTQAASERYKARKPADLVSKFAANKYVYDSADVHGRANHAFNGEGEDDDDDGFEPIRIPRRRVNDPHWQPSFGAPITVDQKMANLDDIHRSVVEDFVQHAKAVCQKILRDKSLRNPPFTDTVLREFGIILPQTLDEMKLIEGADEERVNFHGPRILPLIKNARNLYESMKENEDRETPQDPNHENVINLVSDDEDEGMENEDDGSFFDDDHDMEFEEGHFDQEEEATEDEESEQRSQYFDTRPPEVRAFNSQFAATRQRRESDAGRQTSRAPRKSSISGSVRRKPSYRGNRGKSFRGGFKQSRGGASAPRRKSSTAKTSARGGKPSSGRGASSSRRGGGIAMMPV